MAEIDKPEPIDEAVTASMTISEIASVLNRNGIDTLIDMPDFVLATFCWDSMHALRLARKLEGKFYRHTDEERVG